MGKWFDIVRIVTINLSYFYAILLKQVPLSVLCLIIILMTIISRY